MNTSPSRVSAATDPTSSFHSSCRAVQRRSPERSPSRIPSAGAYGLHVRWHSVGTRGSVELPRTPSDAARATWHPRRVTCRRRRTLSRDPTDQDRKASPRGECGRRHPRRAPSGTRASATWPPGAAFPLQDEDPWISLGGLLGCGRARSESDRRALRVPPRRCARVAACAAARRARARRCRLRSESRRALRQPDDRAPRGGQRGDDREHAAGGHGAAAAEPRSRVREHAPVAGRRERAVHAARPLRGRRGAARNRDRAGPGARPAGDRARQPHAAHPVARGPALLGRKPAHGR